MFGSRPVSDAGLGQEKKTGLEKQLVVEKKPLTQKRQKKKRLPMVKETAEEGDVEKNDLKRSTRKARAL